MIMKKSGFRLLIAALLFPLFFAGCEQDTVEETVDIVVYETLLSPLNTEANNGMETRGSFTFTQRDDTVIVVGEVNDAYPGIMHLMHLHGFEDGSEAQCAPDEADKNDDGVIDLIETRDYSGITMIPLHSEPVTLEIHNESYPIADNRGNMRYEGRFMKSDLDAAVKEKFGIDTVNFNNFVLYVHGVAEDTTLAESVQSLPDVPANITIPISCGELEQIQTK
ncbi:MAG: hypothetical protein ACOC2K_03150 [Bacteroidota bacterium]